MTRDRHTRRRFIVAGGAVAVAGAAGCLHDEGPAEPGDEEENDVEEDDEFEDDEEEEENGEEEEENGEEEEEDGEADERVDEFLAEANLFEAIEDLTGEGEVSVDVGAGDQGMAFEPAAIRIDAGTTVNWEWTGEGGQHDVVSDEESDFDFDSGEPEEDGEFDHTFEEAGVGLYVCTPHENQGMKGAVVVEE